MKNFKVLAKLSAGDQVAVISPSAGLPAIFPWVLDLGINRLEQEFKLKVKEYPTTREANASLEDRAQDIQSAFEDKNNKAVFASIGGSDQIRLIKYLNKDIFLENPKPFFGYSDNTHLQIFLWNLGIPSYYGGSIMTQFAMQNKMHDLTHKYISKALFDKGPVALESSEKFTDIGLDWSDKENLDKLRVHEKNEGWFWDGSKDASGVLWGGCVESLIVQFTTSKYLPASKNLQNTVLFIETAEDIPDHWIVEYLLTGMGERGWLDLFNAVLVGRPKAWEYDKQNDAKTKKDYKSDQRKTILDTIRKYNSLIPVVQNLDFGHTDPQIIVPMGKRAVIDSTNKTINFEY